MKYRKVHFNSSVIIILFFLFPLWSFCQNEGSLLIVTNIAATISIDGEAKGTTEPKKAIKFILAAGEHYILTEGNINGLKADAAQVITIEPGKQKIVQLELKEVTKQQAAGPGVPEELTPISVAALNFTLPGQADDLTNVNSGRKTFYYAFEKGDIILLNFTMTNKKGTNGISVSTYPDRQQKYSNGEFNELKGLRIKVETRSIYSFTFYTNHIFGRDCYLTLQRIPSGASTIDFNPNTVFKRSYSTVVLHPPQQFYINSTSNETWKGGDSKVTLPVQLPSNTIEWYYQFSAIRNKDEIEGTRKEFKLMGQLTSIITGISGPALNISLGMLTTPPGSDYCNTYLLDDRNRTLFENNNAFNYFIQGSRENFQSGTVKINSSASNRYYIGIQNKATMDGIHVIIEVVAITYKDTLTMAEEDR